MPIRPADAMLAVIELVIGTGGGVDRRLTTLLRDDVRVALHEFEVLQFACLRQDLRHVWNSRT